MARKLGQFKASSEWARHFRPWGKRAYWKAERQLAKRDARRQLADQS